MPVPGSVMHGRQHAFCCEQAFFLAGLHGVHGLHTFVQKTASLSSPEVSTQRQTHTDRQTDTQTHTDAVVGEPNHADSKQRQKLKLNKHTRVHAQSDTASERWLVMLLLLLMVMVVVVVVVVQRSGRPCKCAACLSQRSDSQCQWTTCKRNSAGGTTRSSSETAAAVSAPMCSVDVWV